MQKRLTNYSLIQAYQKSKPNHTFEKNNSDTLIILLQSQYGIITLRAYMFYTLSLLRFCSQKSTG